LIVANFTCKDCDQRHPGCHDKCEKYQAEKKVYEERKAAERKRIDLQGALYAQRDRGVRKAKRKAKYEWKWFNR
jgi:hypothetical protein